ncbi:MAG: hypothetical protein DI535_24410 [Citrobacter freundii]|nr:MAG: hypothetical protein DI535_24410 [Citrobacter freundii]
MFHVVYYLGFIIDFSLEPQEKNTKNRYEEVSDLSPFVQYCTLLKFDGAKVMMRYIMCNLQVCEVGV